jgi:hypothetical protein
MTAVPCFCLFLLPRAEPNPSGKGIFANTKLDAGENVFCYEYHKVREKLASCK